MKSSSGPFGNGTRYQISKRRNRANGTVRLTIAIKYQGKRPSQRMKATMKSAADKTMLMKTLATTKIADGTTTSMQATNLRRTNRGPKSTHMKHKTMAA